MYDVYMNVCMYMYVFIYADVCVCMYVCMHVCMYFQYHLGNNFQNKLFCTLYRGVVPRFSQIEYSGWDQFGGPIQRRVDGFHARVVQHECDHLLGVLYPMRIKDFSKFGFTEVLFPEIAAAEEDDD